MFRQITFWAALKSAARGSQRETTRRTRFGFSLLESRCMLSVAPAPGEFPIEVRIADGEWREVSWPEFIDLVDAIDGLREPAERGVHEAAPRGGLPPAGLLTGQGSDGSTEAALFARLRDFVNTEFPGQGIFEIVGSEGDRLAPFPIVDVGEGNWRPPPPVGGPPMSDDLGGYLEMSAPADDLGSAATLIDGADPQEPQQVQNVLSNMHFKPDDFAAAATSAAAQFDLSWLLAGHTAASDDGPPTDSEALLSEDKGGMIALGPTAIDEVAANDLPWEELPFDVPAEVESAYGRFQAFEVSTAEKVLASPDALALLGAGEQIAPPTAAATTDDAEASPPRGVALPPEPSSDSQGVRLPSATPAGERPALADEAKDDSGRDTRDAASVIGRLRPTPQQAAGAGLATIIIAARATRTRGEQSSSRRGWLRRRQDR